MSFVHSAVIRLPLLRWWGWLLLTTTAFALLIATRYFVGAELDGEIGSLVFRTAMLVAHFALLSAILLSPVLAAAVLRAPAWLVIPFGAAVSAATLLALLIDTQVYALYRFHINPGVMNLLLGGAARETFDFSTSMYVQAGAIAAAIAILQSCAAWLWWKYVQRSPGNPRAARALATTLLGAIVGFHSLHVWADATAYEPFLEQTDVLPLRYAATAKRSLRALGVEVRSRPSMVWRADPSNLTYPLYPLKCTPASAPPNIIVIMVDSWRYDALNAQVTPHLNRFADRTVRFMDHHSGGNATRIGVFSLFYSIPGTYWHRVLAERRGPVFIEEMLDQGYEVRAFRSAPLFSPEFDRTVFSQVPGVRMRSEGATAAERDRDLTNDFVAFLNARSSDTPFFALLFFDSPHKMIFPRRYPQVFQPSAREVNYWALNAASDPAPLLNRYRNSVHYVDSLIGEALAEIDKRGLLENSVIVITGDHGQEFNDNGRGFWGHGSNFSSYQTRVPMLLYAPAQAPGVRAHRTTHFDVAPTLLREHLGCEAPFFTHSVGAPLFEPGGRDTMVLSEYADFAIVTTDKIAVIRKQGMKVLGPGYSELDEGRLAPHVIDSALEQKSRFYRRVRQSSNSFPPSPSGAQATAASG